MRYFLILAVAFLPISRAEESLGQVNHDPSVVSLVIPKGKFSGYSVSIHNHGRIFECYDRLDSGHKFEVIKLAGNNLNFKWGPKISFTPHFSVPVRLVVERPEFAQNKDRLSAVVGYLTISGTEEAIKLTLAK